MKYDRIEYAVNTYTDIFDLKDVYTCNVISAVLEDGDDVDLCFLQMKGKLDSILQNKIYQKSKVSDEVENESEVSDEDDEDENQ